MVVGLHYPLMHCRASQAKVIILKSRGKLFSWIEFEIWAGFELSGSTENHPTCRYFYWPSLAFLAFEALDGFLKQKLAFADKD